MVQTVKAQDVTIRDLSSRFHLTVVDDDQFFPEWQLDLPPLTATEATLLDKIRAGYFNLLQHPPLLEKAVQLSVLAPLFFLADFYLPPFHIRAEDSLAISQPDGEAVIRGQLDVVLLKDDFWVVVIESKQAEFSVEAGLSQLLTYMLASPEHNSGLDQLRQRPIYGLVTTGGEFLFVKLMLEPMPRYATSDQFVLRKRGNELYDVFRILKRLAQL